MPAMIELKGITKLYGTGAQRVPAIGNVSFTVEAGEFVSIVGPSGCGKSTLLNMIAGFLAPTSGSVTVAGAPVTSGRVPAGLGYIFQKDTVLPWLNVGDNIGLGLRYRHAPRAEIARKVTDLLAMAGLSGYDGLYPHQLSGGMRQRVNVARALAVDPKILLLDEPFAALDAQTREIMQTELLKIWSAQRKTVVLITHQIDEAVFLSDRVVVFSARPGRIRADIPIELPRPRELGLKRSMEFVRLVDEIWTLIEQEVRLGMTLAQE
jgi:NitT/TauT family transport system ATP-binding protein